MCGRTGLSLSEGEIECACTYKLNNNTLKPQWVDENNLNKKYTPSYNIYPGEVTPVLLSASSFGKGENDEQIIMPMIWGMVPQEYKASTENYMQPRHTHSCPVESLAYSNMYSNALENRKRCVILAEGFYTWDNKIPHFTYYCPQSEGVVIWDRSTWGSKTPQLLRIAGLYEKWTSSDGDSLYAYSIITMNSGNSFTRIFPRMPAILHDDHQVADWLNVKRVRYSEAIQMLQPMESIISHRVSTEVGNASNNNIDCYKPVTIEEFDPKQIKTSCDRPIKNCSGFRAVKNNRSKKKKLSEPKCDINKGNVKQSKSNCSKQTEPTTINQFGKGDIRTYFQCSNNKEKDPVIPKRSNPENNKQSDSKTITQSGLKTNDLSDTNTSKQSDSKTIKRSGLGTINLNDDNIHKQSESTAIKEPDSNNELKREILEDPLDRENEPQIKKIKDII